MHDAMACLQRSTSRWTSGMNAAKMLRICHVPEAAVIAIIRNYTNVGLIYTSKNQHEIKRLTFQGLRVALVM